MGNSSSNSQEYERAISVFNSHEKDQLKSIFENLCQSKQHLSREDLRKLTSPFLPGEVSDNVHNYMRLAEVYIAESAYVTGPGFVIALAHSLKGSLEEKAAVFHCMACGNSTHDATLQQISNLVSVLYEGYRIGLEQSPELSTWGFSNTETRDKSGLFTKALVHGLVSQDNKLLGEMEYPDPSTTYNKDQVEKWLSRSSLLLTMFDTVSQLCFPIYFVGDVVSKSNIKAPMCKKAENVKSLLDLPSLIYLTSRIPHDLRQQWTLLYSSNTHGESFSTMCGRVLNKGPTVLLIKDTKGHVFGGYASESWSPNAKFVGSQECFLYNLQPYMQAYYASGYNSNFMYFHHSQETLPNGLGMGGQFEYFGLWLDQEFTKGHSRAEPRCTTYNSPQLSADPHFTVNTIEVWRVGPEPKKPETYEAEGTRGSILDKDPGAKAMLTLIDKGPHSEGLREADATADIPETHHLHPTQHSSP